jgi:hypothetical protein
MVISSNDTNSNIRTVETASVNILTGEIIPSIDSDEYNAWKKNMVKIPSIESYYFSAKGNLLGLIPDTRFTMTVEGPFISFDSKTRILTSQNGEKIILIAGKEETTNMPKIYDRTKKELKRLTIR